MPASRPTECPACGHDRPRRISARRNRVAPAEPAGERWVCGLCRYEWIVASPQPVYPEGPVI